MTTVPLPEFSISDPLPTGLTVLEASAGTGKTYSLAGLVTRCLAEGVVEAAQVCVVSFTVPATAELRGRIREKLAEAARHLETGEPSTDDVIALLLADADERVVRRERVLTALAEFDAATISTIHGFCSRVVATGAGSGVDVTFTSDDSDVDEVVNDRFLDRFSADGDWPAEPKKVAEAVRLRLRIPDADLFVPDRSLLTRGDSHERADLIDRIVVLVDDVVAEVRARRVEAASPHLRQPPRRGPRSPRRPPGRDHPNRAAAAVPVGDDRRVPGHRPRPVGHLPYRVPRRPEPGHRGRRRRPEAVDLPLPLRRALGVPRRPGPGRTAGHQPGHQPTFRRGAHRCARAPVLGVHVR